jgi:hypothetical protein
MFSPDTSPPQQFMLAHPTKSSTFGRHRNSSSQLLTPGGLVVDFAIALAEIDGCKLEMI